MKEEEERAKTEQSLKSILVSKSRDFLISSDGKRMPVSELEGKTVGLYFSALYNKSYADFTPKLVKVYEELKEKGEGFEIVLKSLDIHEESFKRGFRSVPWALPFKDKSCEKLTRYFELSTLPTLVIIGPDGKTLNSNVAEAVEEHGVEAFPFTPEKFAELAEIEKAKEAAQTVESVLVSGRFCHWERWKQAMQASFHLSTHDDFYLLFQIPMSDLVGKTILLYFSARWRPPCRAFFPKLMEAYHKIKAKNESIEVVFISSDMNQASFDGFFLGMSWLALPFGDPRKASLSRKLKVYSIPMLVALGPSGRTVTKETRDMISVHGAEAYPFTEEHLKNIEANYQDMKKVWPEKAIHALPEHEIVRSRHTLYKCDGCDEERRIWSFYCEGCDFHLHPKCALKEEKETKDDDAEEDKPNKKGWICFGDACHKGLRY
ncbi:hypothetical protein Patl1_16123 [Pistacia atlantica]|uniref:Uncharacterized protein n=1 Tax=Pistacia atlantica TaxID=434234 RepID=A0ACC1B6N4_9ROSI|nr:hypothetical protein Patl1_16123 [Pistacia atlantica]